MRKDQLEAVGDFAEPIYDLIDELGDSSIVLDNLIRYLDGDTIEDFVKDFRRHHDMPVKNDDDMEEGIEGMMPNTQVRGIMPKQRKPYHKHKIKSNHKPETDLSEAHQIDWPDKDEDGDSKMEQHAYNAIRHGMHAYDAYDHVYSMSREREWLSANKDDIIKMFAKYGLKTESLEESEEKNYVCVHAKKGKHECKATSSYGAAKKAAEHWGLKSTSGIDAHLADEKKTATESMLRNVTKELTEAEFDEAAGEKDACYHKVKSRYKVWPSAYASGALVKCRKVGAANWGNSKK